MLIELTYPSGEKVHVNMALVRTVQRVTVDIGGPRTFTRLWFGGGDGDENAKADNTIPVRETPKAIAALCRPSQLGPADFEAAFGDLFDMKASKASKRFSEFG